MGASVVAGVDAVPGFEAAEHDLDAMAVAVGLFAVADRNGAASPAGDARADAASGQRGAASGLLSLVCRSAQAHPA